MYHVASRQARLGIECGTLTLSCWLVWAQRAPERLLGGTAVVGLRCRRILSGKALQIIAGNNRRLPRAPYYQVVTPHVRQQLLHLS